MSNSLDFIIKLTDLFSPKMGEAGRIAETAANKISNQFGKIDQSGKRMNASISELKGRLDAINRVRFTTLIAREFDVATRAANRLERQIERLEGRGQRSGGGGGLASMIPGLGLVAGVGAAITASSSAEMSKTNFSTLLGSKDKGNAMYGDLNKFANETVFDNAGVYKNAQTLLAFGTAGDKILPTLKMLGDVSVGDQQKMEGLTLAFAQVTSAGKLGGQDLMQFVNAGFNPLNEIAKATGISMGDLRDKMSKGAITSDMVAEAFRRATAKGGMFHDALKNAGDTVSGKWGVFMGNIQTKLVALGDFFKPVTKLVLDFGNMIMDNKPAMVMLASGIGLIAIATGGWSVAQSILNFVMGMNPIVRIISLILILGGIIYTVAKQFSGWAQSMRGVWEIIKDFVKLSGLAFKDFGQTIWYHIQFAWLKVEEFVQKVGGAIKNVMTALNLAAHGEFSAAKEAITAKITVSATKDIEALEKKHNIDRMANMAEAKALQTHMAASFAKIGLHRVHGGAKKEDSAGGGDGKGNGVFDSLKANGGGDAASGRSRADDINGGGQRSIVINIGKQIEKIEMHVAGSAEAGKNVEMAVRDAMKRVFYNLNDQVV